MKTINRILTFAVILFVTCYVNSVKAQNTVNGHEYIDLGLSVKWATCNVGAKKPYDDGDTYTWGASYKCYDKSYKKKDCYTWKRNMEDYTGYPGDDVATYKWGSSWRTPTKEELHEMYDNCTFEYDRKHGGMICTSRINGIRYSCRSVNAQCQKEKYTDTL